MVVDEFKELELERGTLIKLAWLDITEDSVGDPTKATMMLRHTYTLFWELKVDHGRDCIVTTYTVDKESPAQQGWCITPLEAVEEIEVIRRPKKTRKKKE
jgi:hypothetical protein